MRDLPEKYYSIKQASEIIGVKPHVLRFWESEFAEIKPKKNKAGRRLYQKKDIALILQIKQLLYNEGFTIQGAKQKLKSVNKPALESLPDKIELNPGLSEFLTKLRSSISNLNAQIADEVKNMDC